MSVSNTTRGPGGPRVGSSWRVGEMAAQGPGFPVLVLTHGCLWLQLPHLLVSPGAIHARSTYTGKVFSRSHFESSHSKAE